MLGPSRKLAPAVVPIGRLACLLACVALATSRFGLIAHEYVGHGGAALARGGSITEVRLFWFAGGWIRYEVPGATLADWILISMGGIACELVVGGALAVVAWRRAGLGWTIVRALGATFAVHALWYLATGVWHGYGDGALLYRALGDSRYPLAVAAGALACTAAYFGARAIVGPLLATLPRARVGGLVLAAIVAGGANLALDLGELHVRRDEVYTQTMQPERERRIAADYAAWLAAQERAHVAISDEDAARRHAQLEVVHPAAFPFAVVLALGLLVGVVLGGARSPQREAAISRGLLVRAAVAAAVGLAAVIAIGLT